MLIEARRNAFELFFGVTKSSRNSISMTRHYFGRSQVPFLFSEMIKKIYKYEFDPDYLYETLI